MARNNNVTDRMLVQIYRLTPKKEVMTRDEISSNASTHPPVTNINNIRTVWSLLPIDIPSTLRSVSALELDGKTILSAPLRNANFPQNQFLALRCCHRDRGKEMSLSTRDQIDNRATRDLGNCHLIERSWLWSRSEPNFAVQRLISTPSRRKAHRLKSAKNAIRLSYACVEQIYGSATGSCGEEIPPCPSRSNGKLNSDRNSSTAFAAPKS